MSKTKLIIIFKKNQKKTCIIQKQENDTMAPIILDSVTIVGKAIGLYRKI